MYELVYQSKTSKNLSVDDILSIQKHSTRSNLENNVSGCLVLLNNYFVAILEGEEKVVQELYDKIVNDNRHSKIELLTNGYVRARQFEKWNMIFQIADGKKKESLSDILFLRNLNSLVQLAEKKTYGSQVFWKKVKELVSLSL